MTNEAFKQEETLIELSNKLKGENTKELLSEIKNLIRELTKTKLFRIKEFIKEENGEIIIDKEKVDFALRLINKDKKLYEQIERLKHKKEKELKIKDLTTIEENIKNMEKEIISALSNLKPTQKKETKLPIIKQIQSKRNKKIYKEQLEEKLDNVITIIEKYKQIQENKDLKEKYFVEENMKETIDVLYKKCRIKDISDIEGIKTTLKQKCSRILIKINKDMQKQSQQEETHYKYDKRLVEYVYDKKNNYVTYIIDYLSKEEENIVAYAIKILNKIDNIENDKESIEETYPNTYEQKIKIKKIK